MTTATLIRHLVDAGLQFRGLGHCHRGGKHWQYTSRHGPREEAESSTSGSVDNRK